MTTPPPIPLAQQIAFIEYKLIVASEYDLTNRKAKATYTAILASLQSLEARVVAAKREGMEEAAKMVDEIYEENFLNENYSILRFIAAQICKAAAKLGTETGEKNDQKV